MNENKIDIKKTIVSTEAFLKSVKASLHDIEVVQTSLNHVKERELGLALQHYFLGITHSLMLTKGFITPIKLEQLTILDKSST